MSLIGRIIKKDDKVNVPGRGLVLWKQIPTLLKALGLAKDVKLMVDGADVLRETEDGLYVKIGQGDESDYPFKVTISGENFHIAGGLFNGTVVAASNGTMAPSGHGYFYLAAVYTLQSTSSGYVYSSSLDSASFYITATPISDEYGPSSGTFWILLADSLNGVKQNQYIRTSLSADVCDSGNDDGTANITTYAT